MSLPRAPDGPPGEIDWPEGVLFGLAVGQWLWGGTLLVLAVQLLAGAATPAWMLAGSGASAALCWQLRRRWLKAEPRGLLLILRLALALILALGSVWAIFKALGRLL